MKGRFGGPLIVLLAGLLATGTILAGNKDPWMAKAYDQWTDQDIHQILTMSPWALKVSVEGTWKPLSPLEMNAATPGLIPGSSGGSTSLGATAGGGNGRSTIMAAEHDPNAVTRGENVPFLIYWMSSRTMRAAVARKAMLHSGSDAKQSAAYVDQPQETYQIVVQGADLAPFQRQGEKAYESLAWLQLKKSKDKILPSKVEFQKDGKGAVTAAIFHFPKKGAAGEAVIPADAKGVEFDCKVGASTIKAYFDPSKMVDSRGSDL